MTLEEFKNQTNGKIFVELKGTAVSSFTDLTIPEGAETGPGYEMRNWASEKGILVFLSDIHRIFAKGMYYGCDPDQFDALSSRVTALGNSVTDILTNVATLQSDVTSLDGRVDELEGWTKEKATTIEKNVNDISTLTSNLAALQAQVNGLDPNHIDDGGSNAIQDAIDARISNLLGFSVKDEEHPDGTWNNTEEGGTVIQVIKNLKTSVSEFSNSLNNKADLIDFNTLAAKIGAGESLPWWSENPTEDNPNKTIVTVVNENKNSIQTLNTIVSGIPKFTIAVVPTLPTNTPENPISRTTIYLVPQQQTNPEEPQEGEEQQETQNNKEMFEEYIWVNKNAAKDGAEENWGWERLGSQFFNIETYVDQDTLNAIKQDLQNQITTIADQVNNSLEGRISTNETNIASLQELTQDLSDELHSLIENGVFKLTGSSIYTNDNKTSYIANDIADLQSGKLDVSALEWAVIGEQEQSGN